MASRIQKVSHCEVKISVKVEGDVIDVIERVGMIDSGENCIYTDRL